VSKFCGIVTGDQVRCFGLVPSVLTLLPQMPVERQVTGGFRLLHSAWEWFQVSMSFWGLAVSWPWRTPLHPCADLAWKWIHRTQLEPCHRECRFIGSGWADWCHPGTLVDCSYM